MNKEGEILHKILHKVGYEKRGELEKRINQLINENPRLSRLGALYLIGEELGIFEQVDSVEYTVPIAKLVGGLNNVNVRCRVIGKRGPFKTDKTEYAYLRLGDNSGVISAIAWNEALKKIKEMNVDVGDVVIIKDAYTRESINGKTELHLNKTTVIKKDEDSDIQSLEAFFKEELPSNEKEFEVDVKAKILGLSDELSIYYRGEKIPLREALLLVSDIVISTTAWRGQVELFKDASPGQTALIAAAKYQNKKLIMTSKTCIKFITDTPEDAIPPLEIIILDKLNLKDEDYIYIAACSNYILFVKHPDIQLGRSYIVKKYELIYSNKRWLLIPQELIEIQKNSAGGVQPIYSLSSLSDDLSYVCVEGRVESKTSLASKQLKNGEELETLNFWLTDGVTNIYCRAFGKSASIINYTPEKSLIRLKWARVRKTKFGYIELIVDDASNIELIREG